MTSDDWYRAERERLSQEYWAARDAIQPGPEGLHDYAAEDALIERHWQAQRDLMRRYHALIEDPNHEIPEELRDVAAEVEE
jgi:hypothetical protein